MQYATPADFTEFAGEGHTVTQQDLNRAQTVVDEMTLGVAYDVTDADTLTVLKRATCAQAAWFEETGDPSGARSILGGASIGSVSLGATGTSTRSNIDANAARYAREAIAILRVAGLLNRTVEYR